MRCKWCRRKIGVLRRLLDEEYCSNSHRKLAKTASARELRDARYIYGEDDYPLPLEVEGQTGSARASASRTSLSGFAVLLGLFLLAMIWLPQVGETPAPPARSENYAVPTESVWSRLRDNLSLSGKSRLSLKEDFASGLRNWQAENVPSLSSSSATSWVVRTGSAQPKELRLWAPSMNLQNYDLDFDAQIEQKAVGWAFRAQDLENYYAAKIVLSRPAPFPISEIVRYAVLNGHERDRVQLPLPMQLQRGTLYRVKVRVKGSTFVTSVNGEVVDSWQDGRLRAGGIGFFADKGEVASILGVRVSEEKGLLERIFLPAMFTPPYLR